jgi:NAD(P)-dependent dehydrogenase (short-subunit alcohol dehydrogenase family)
LDPAGKVALVTGSGLGIGRGIAGVLAKAGASIVVNDIDEVSGCATVGRIEEAGGQAAFVRADITSTSGIDRMLEFAEKTYGGLDILVNNAGAGDPPGFPIAHPERWNAVLDVYLRAPMATIQYALPLFDKRGGGVIVNISSLGGVGYKPYWWPEYAAAKAAIIRLTASLGDLAEQRKVRVNCVAPNWVATEKVLATVARMTPAQRKESHVPDELATPEDIGEVVLEFVRDDSLAGRIIHHYEPGMQRLVAVDSWPD